ncbi:oligoendopeptidase F [Paenibacillus koleovorans]|uniref:oligoendopeptidase F n=1 Tax=Paenibacillus koleovorans TaxID=121608 RepID=UPI000FD8C0F1|nr:oligoendopeptidase F [Paenibacillus koleovorans]
MTRESAPEELTWNLQDLYADQTAWEAARVEIEGLLPALEAFRGKLAMESRTLAECLQAQETLQVKLVRVSTYARLQLAQDGTDSEFQANSARMGDLISRVNSALAFIRSELLSLPDGLLERFLEEEPELGVFRRSLLNLLRTKPHALSPDTEAALAALGDVLGSPYTVYQRSKLSDMTFASVKDGTGADKPVSFALFEADYEQSPDPVLRRASFESFTNTLTTYRHTIAAAYATEVKKQIVLSRLRGYPSVTRMLLEPQEVEQEIYENVIHTIRIELAPAMRRFVKLKERVLGLDRIRFCDLKAPLDPDFSPSVTIEEAGRLLKEALAVMGTEYSAIIHAALTERWVDYADNIGKSTGAFCSSPYGAHAYIMLTWANTMRSAFFLAHELGHAGHLMLAARTQRYVNFLPSMFFIEAPSTLNELLLARHIVRQSEEPRLKRWVLLELMNTYSHNFVTHLLEADMQRRAYEAAELGTPLTAAKLTALKEAVLREFWGDAVELDTGAGLTWMRQPHYYMGLYPYTYAAGLTMSTQVAAMIEAEGQPAVDRWLRVLQAGGTLAPLQLAKLAGVDMSSPAPIRAAVQYVSSIVEELERMFTMVTEVRENMETEE